MVLLIILIILSLVGHIVTFSKYMGVCKELYMQNDLYIYYRNKLSMIEYHYRQYKEGTNVYTSMRKIGDILYKSFYDDM